MLKNMRIALAILMSSVLLTGCFDIVEEVHYKKDGSGTYKFTMDMSGLQSLMAMAMAADTTGQMNLDTLSAFSREMAQKVQGISGISNIREIGDAESLVFGIEFNFANLEALNKAATEVAADEIYGKSEKPTFKGAKKEFTRLDAKGFSSLMDQMMGEGGEEMEMAKMFLKDVSYTMIYHFDRKVKKVSNKLATVSEDKKSVTLKYFMFDDERGGAGASIENSIKLK